jgi:hypothetical protein
LKLISKKISDPRRHNKKHKLIDIITISICTVICGAEGFEHIEELEKSKKRSVKRKRLKAGWDNSYLQKVIFSA